MNDPANLHRPARPARVTSAFEVEIRGDGLDRVALNTDYAPAFALSQFPSYESFFTRPGERLKHEEDTTIWRIAPAHDGPAFILKEYRFRSTRYLRTLFARPRAEREFLALVRARELGVPCVEPVAFGVRPKPFGGIGACFIVTPELEGRQTLKAWLQSHGTPDPLAADKLNTLLEEVGASLRRLHAAEFFLITLFAKNVLVSETDDRLEWTLIDLPHARTIRRTRTRRRIQTHGIGGFLHSVTKFAGAEFEDAFYRAYLPEPFGRSEAALRAAADLGARPLRKRVWWRRLFGIAK